MGQVSILTKEQETILDLVADENFFSANFYFTGGTALSAFHLHHRESVDLDFFSFNRFDTQAIDQILKNWSSQHQFTIESEYRDPLYVCFLSFPKKIRLKVDFSYFPHKRLENGGMHRQLSVDGLLDIAVNKILAITQRIEVKDFVDLYFLLQKFSVWDLREGVRIKFQRDLEPMLLGADLLSVEDFTFLPKMHLPLTLDELKAFFREEAKKLGRDVVE